MGRQFRSAWSLPSPVGLSARSRGGKQHEMAKKHRSDPLLHKGFYARMHVLARGNPRLLRVAGGGLTVSRYSGVHRRFLSLSFCGCFQLLFQPADITVCLGLHDAQLRVDVLVLVAGVFLILSKGTRTTQRSQTYSWSQGGCECTEEELGKCRRKKSWQRGETFGWGNARISHTKPLLTAVRDLR